MLLSVRRVAGGATGGYAKSEKSPRRRFASQGARGARPFPRGAARQDASRGRRSTLAGAAPPRENHAMRRSSPAGWFTTLVALVAFLKTLGGGAGAPEKR